MGHYEEDIERRLRELRQRQKAETEREEWKKLMALYQHTTLYNFVPALPKPKPATSPTEIPLIVQLIWDEIEEYERNHGARPWRVWCSVKTKALLLELRGRGCPYVTRGGWDIVVGKAQIWSDSSMKDDELRVDTAWTQPL